MVDTTELKKAMDTTFRFKVGDIVRHKHQPPRNNEERFNLERRWAFCVVARGVEECHGGVQIFYTCRAVSNGGCDPKSEYRIFDFELVAEA